MMFLQEVSQMEYVTLGRSGLKISRLGFGGIPIQRIDATQSQELMNAVRAAGINYIDTARGYTVSEELIGQAIEGHRNEFVLATKSMARDKSGMAKDIDISLNNLRTDYIDLYQIHNCPPEQLEQVCSADGALAALQEAKAAGKIGHIGLTTHSLDTLRLALDMDWVETLMFPYNIVENQAEDLMAQAKEKNIGFIVMKPLAGGAIENGPLALRYISGKIVTTWKRLHRTLPPPTTPLPSPPRNLPQPTRSVKSSATTSAAAATTAHPARWASAFQPCSCSRDISSATVWRSGHAPATKQPLSKPAPVWSAAYVKPAVPTSSPSEAC